MRTMSLLQEIVVFVIVGLLFNHYRMCNGRPATEVANVVDAAAKPFPIQKPLTKFAAGTLASILLEKLLYLDKGDNAECGLSIHNKLNYYRLVNPFLFIVHGENPMPAPIKVDTNKSEETSMVAAVRTGATSGILFYEIESIGQYLMIFWKVQGPQVLQTYTPNRFSVALTSTVEFDNKVWLDTTYQNFKKQADEMKDRPNEHLQTVTQVMGFKVTIQAQMTSGKKAELMVEVKDDLPPPVEESDFHKRDVIGTTLALAVIPLGLNLAFKKIQSVIPSEQSCTISLENLCEDEILTKPAWYIRAGETSNIVPWEIKKDEVGEISFVVPLGGPRIKDALKHTVYFLSYHIEPTSYDMVIGTWFPWKLEQKDDWETVLQKEKPRYTVFIMETPPPALPMKQVLNVVGELLLSNKDAASLNEKLIKTNAVLYKLIAHPASLISHKIPLVEATKLQSYLEWHYPMFKKTVSAGATSTDEYHMKIVTGMGIGKATGMVVKIQIVKGSSPARFAKSNPQRYTEPPNPKPPQAPKPKARPTLVPSTNAGLPKFPIHLSLPASPTKKIPKFSDLPASKTKVEGLSTPLTETTVEELSPSPTISPTEAKPLSAFPKDAAVPTPPTEEYNNGQSTSPAQENILPTLAPLKKTEGLSEYLAQLKDKGNHSSLTETENKIFPVILFRKYSEATQTKNASPTKAKNAEPPSFALKKNIAFLASAIQAKLSSKRKDPGVLAFKTKGVLPAAPTNIKKAKHLTSPTRKKNQELATFATQRKDASVPTQKKNSGLADLPTKTKSATLQKPEAKNPTSQSQMNPSASTNAGPIAPSTQNAGTLSYSTQGSNAVAQTSPAQTNYGEVLTFPIQANSGGIPLTGILPYPLQANNAGISSYPTQGNSVGIPASSTQTNYASNGLPAYLTQGKK